MFPVQFLTLQQLAIALHLVDCVAILIMMNFPMIFLNFPIVPVLSLLLFHALLLRRARRAMLPVVALLVLPRISSIFQTALTMALSLFPAYHSSAASLAASSENFSKALLINVSIMEHFLLRILFTISTTTSRAAVTSVVFADILTDSVILTHQQIIGSQSPTASTLVILTAASQVLIVKPPVAVLLEYVLPLIMHGPVTALRLILITVSTPPPKSTLFSIELMFSPILHTAFPLILKSYAPFIFWIRHV